MSSIRTPALIESFTLRQFLLNRDYALGVSPGFFRFYAYMGILHALQDTDTLRPSHVSGSSAGALVCGFLAAGMKPKDMIQPVLSLDRKDMWDIGGFGGLLKGYLFQHILEKYLPIHDIENCIIPFGATAFNLFQFQTSCITSGSLPSVIRASCTFPILFQPVILDGSPHIDGGIFDYNGLMALPGVPDTKIIVNILSDIRQLQLPKSLLKFGDVTVVSLVLKDIPSVSPFTMRTSGPVAYLLALKATLIALDKEDGLIRVGPSHWMSYIDGCDVKLPPDNRFTIQKYVVFLVVSRSVSGMDVERELSSLLHNLNGSADETETNAEEKSTETAIVSTSGEEALTDNNQANKKKRKVISEGNVTNEKKIEETGAANINPRKVTRTGRNSKNSNDVTALGSPVLRRRSKRLHLKKN